MAILRFSFSLMRYIFAVHDRLQQQYRARASDGLGENRNFLPESESTGETAGQYLRISKILVKKLFSYFSQE